MKNGPELFSNYGKKSKDVLTKDYLLDQKISVTTTSVTGVALTSTATNKGGVSTGDVGAVYKSKNASIAVKFDAKSNITMTLTLKDIMPSTNTLTSLKFHDFKSGKIATTLSFEDIGHSTKVIASFQLPDFSTSKIQVQYVHRHATLTTTMALNQAPTIDVLTTIGTPTFAMGANAAYETSSSKLTNFSVGININVPHSTTSIVLGDKGDTIRASYIQYFDVLKKTAAAVEFTKRLSKNKTSFMVGGCYTVDSRTVAKAKLNNRGKLSALLQHEIIRKSLISLSTELDTKALHKTPKFGLAIVLKL